MPIVRGVICDQCGTMMYWCGNVSKARAAVHARNDGWTIGKKMFVSGLHNGNESRKREVKQKRRNRRERGKRTDDHRQDISLS